MERVGGFSVLPPLIIFTTVPKEAMAIIVYEVIGRDIMAYTEVPLNHIVLLSINTKQTALATIVMKV